MLGVGGRLETDTVNTLLCDCGGHCTCDTPPPTARAHPVRQQAWSDCVRCALPWEAYEAYLQQWRNAVNRGIGWEIDLPAWWAIWTADGGLSWSRRGRARRDGEPNTVMARHNDQGPYAPGNVRITTAQGNAQDRPAEKRSLAARRAAAKRDPWFHAFVDDLFHSEEGQARMEAWGWDVRLRPDATWQDEVEEVLRHSYGERRRPPALPDSMDGRPPRPG